MSLARKAQSSETEAELIAEVSNIVMKITGVQLGQRQFQMVQNRVNKRIHQLGLADESEYLNYLRNHRSEETGELVSLLTTHHTYFFREFTHFEYLERTALPNLIKAKRARGEKKIKIWSAACSRGQEVYSLSMFLRHVLKTLAPDFTYEILGTDVDPESVSFAENGVYLFKEIQSAPLHFINGNWVRGKGSIEQYVKAKATIRGPCKFQVLNLCDIKAVSLQKDFDIIFCRNVFIYFKPQQIKDIAKSFLNSLSSGGSLILGISETLNGMDLPVSVVGPSVYCHRQGNVEKIKSEKVSFKVSEVGPMALATLPLRVLCVDDSPMILTILKKILSKENGFNVVGTAANGLEAAKAVRELKPDLMTLDIHMPEQDGLAYLKANIRPDHPPVLMVSSVSREDAGLALSCLEAGATDYVEKPSLANLDERTDEICLKLKYAAESAKGRGQLHLDRSFAKPSHRIANADRKARALIFSLADRKKIFSFVSSFDGPQPPTFLLVEGVGAASASIAKSLQASFASLRVESWDGGTRLPKFAPNTLVICEASAFFKVYKSDEFEKVSIAVYGKLSKRLKVWLKDWRAAQVLIEDRSAQKSEVELVSLVTEYVPATSFYYHSHQYLSQDKV